MSDLKEPEFLRKLLLFGKFQMATLRSFFVVFDVVIVDLFIVITISHKYRWMKYINDYPNNEDMEANIFYIIGVINFICKILISL